MFQVALYSCVLNPLDGTFTHMNALMFPLSAFGPNASMYPCLKVMFFPVSGSLRLIIPSAGNESLELELLFDKLTPKFVTAIDSVVVVIPVSADAVMLTCPKSSFPVLFINK